MDISEEKIEQVITRQLEKASQETDRKIETLVKESDERAERYIGVVKEDSDHKFAVAMEVISSMQDKIQNIEQTVNATLEKVGEIAVDTEMIKAKVSDHDVRLQKIEA